MSSTSSVSPAIDSSLAVRGPAPIVALDVASEREAMRLAQALPEADFVKVGLQLYTVAGPSVVRQLKAAGRRIFLDLKLHDIPNTVARAVESAAGLGVDLLTVHASGGSTMLRAAREAAGDDLNRPKIFAVTVLTSLSVHRLEEAWGRSGLVVADEVVRLAEMANGAGVDGVVASVLEAGGIRARLGRHFGVLTPGIRFAGEGAGEQTRVATPADAAQAGVDYVVVGRSLTGAVDPAASFRRLVAELSAGAEGAG